MHRHKIERLDRMEVVEELDNTQKVIDQERDDFNRDLGCINASIKVVEVRNSTTYTDFVLSHQSKQYENEINTYLKSKMNMGKYEGGITTYQYNILEDNPTRRNDPRCPEKIMKSKETLYIRRNALIPFKRPLKFTLCIQGILASMICYLFLLCFRIVF